MPDLSYEMHYIAEGYPLVCGVDEAGRGPLCGPVVAAAVILRHDEEIPGLNDSKKLSEKKREALFDVIREKALAYSIASASPEEIDEYNILGATMLAMRRAILGLQPTADFALIDGNTVKNIPIPAVGIVKGDALSSSISAASILAKVTRDRLCLEHDKLYPEYGIAGHKGYPTAAHMEAVRKYGPTPIHRRSFLKFLEK
ncbi:MAG: ribonuclease HII [Clostridia bacterium]|nr:ribonuclease HII [Clostridia bacterium]